MDNASKWAKSQVRVSCRKDGDFLRIRVEDDGPGLSAEQMALVAQRGKRFDESVPEHGLGLAIVRDIAQTYGGTLILGRSDLGGLVALLELPLGA